MMETHDWKQLIDSALAARNRAYAPYSKFHVGAALMADDGEIVIGCNVENASYGMTICAERAAVFTAVAAGQRRFRAIAIATSGGLAPCGACRQVLAEFGDELLILLVDSEGTKPTIELSLSQLLPGTFTIGGDEGMRG
jgi:cytidine deaminase